MSMAAAPRMMKMTTTMDLKFLIVIKAMTTVTLSMLKARKPSNPRRHHLLSQVPFLCKMGVNLRK